MTVVNVVDDKLLVTMKDEEGSLLNNLFEHKSHEIADLSPNEVCVNGGRVFTCCCEYGLFAKLFVSNLFS